MAVPLREMFPNELAAFRSYSICDYANDLMSAHSMNQQAALAQAGQEFDELLPGSFLKIIEVDSTPVGVCGIPGNLPVCHLLNLLCV